MADNEQTGTAKAVATVKVTHSGDADQNLQLVTPVFYAGAEGSRTVVDLVRLEDAAHTAGDPGVPVLGFRNDADADSAGSNSDYAIQSMDAGGNANVRARKDLVKVSVQSAGLTTAATAYAAGDQVGNQFTFAGCARKSGGGGMIVGMLLISAADTVGAFDAIVTDSSVTPAADNAAFTLSDADALKIMGLVQLMGAWDIGANRIAQAYNIAMPYTCAATSLFVNLITRNTIAATPFAAATDIQLILFVERN